MNGNLCAELSTTHRLRKPQFVLKSKNMKEKTLRQAQGEKPDHRKLGEQLDLFSFHDVSPGAVFWHPKGMVIYKELEKLIREENEKMGYGEVSTPILVKKELWEKSGHWEKFKDNMFQFQIGNEAQGLKPMNCPEAHLIFASRIRSYQDLPLRLAEPTGRLHRKEVSGSVGGLFRLYQFTQDDAHIYCSPEQIEKEISSLLKLALKIHKMFGFKSFFRLATKPDEALGSPRLWEKAEEALKTALKKSKVKYELREKDGTFYGPKIDVNVTDSLEREWTIATVQIDFQVPERFALEYVDKDGSRKRPVVIHRAMLGSFERFIGILLEHLNGALPLWLSPEQIWIIPIASRNNKYAEKVAAECNEAGFRYIVKDENETVAKKIREGEVQKIPYLLVVGDKEEKAKKVSVRQRGKGNLGQMKFDKFLQKVKREYDERG
ncbi:MAG: threonyl-tRNA synthetase [Parcubacteria group bacterium Gr01-1014_30]|nr:MAG: threonyl-tRNA synthetase [Parcubacteria group bacterium Gr01-1014_30]